MLIFSVSILSFFYTVGLTSPIYKDAFQVYPENPAPDDSIFIIYSYVLNDGCPDYYIEKDSISENKIYISKKTNSRQKPNLHDGDISFLFATKSRNVK